MLFNSYIFIFAFLPITFALYWILRRLGLFRASLCFLTVASLVFYGYQNPYYALLLIGSILVNFGIYRLLRHHRNKTVLIGGIVLNLGILAYFKYLNFFIDNFNRISGCDIAFLKIALPLGISFFTFQQLSFIIDAYRQEIMDYSFIEYALFVSFFPQLVAGPIVLHSEMIPQFRASKGIKAPNIKELTEGATYFILGLAKKVLLADLLGRGVDWGYQNIQYLNSVSAVFLIIGYTLQIYFDFSGYCDMAIGLGSLFGFKITRNFDSPYRALSVGEFWKRWHITLTRFFTTYVYIPLGGNRRGLLRTCINIMLVFALSGLWHGADWTFVLWGALHGLMMVIERLLGDRLNKLPKVIRFIYTFGFVNLAWVLFRAESFTDAANVLKRVLHGGGGLLLPKMQESMYPSFDAPIFDRFRLGVTTNPILYSMITFVVILLCLYFSARHKNTEELTHMSVTRIIYGVTIGAVFVLSILNLSQVSTFLYFNF